MKPKEYLSQYHRAKNRIKQLEIEIYEIEEMMSSTAMPEKTAPSSNPNTKSPQESMVPEKMKREAQKLQEQQQAFDLMDLISRKIRTLREPFSSLLHSRYIEGKRFEQIAIDMNYSYERVRHLHGDALATFGRRFPEIEGFKSLDDILGW